MRTVVVDQKASIYGDTPCNCPQRGQIAASVGDWRWLHLLSCLSQSRRLPNFSDTLSSAALRKLFKSELEGDFADSPQIIRKSEIGSAQLKSPHLADIWSAKCKSLHLQ